MIDIEFTDRYGGGGPNPETMCKGPCDGMGIYPARIDSDKLSEYEQTEIDAAIDQGADSSEGYIFITCPDCKGTGNKENV